MDYCQCVGTELNRQSLKAGELRPLELTDAQPNVKNGQVYNTARVFSLCAAAV